MEIGLYPSGMDELAKRVVSDLRSASFGVNENVSVMSAKGIKMIGNLGNALSAICDGKGDANRYMKRREKRRNDASAKQVYPSKKGRGCPTDRRPFEAPTGCLRM